MLATFAIYLIMAINSAPSWHLTPDYARDPHACPYSEQVYHSDEALMRQKAPTYFRLMTSRYVEIVQAARGYDCSRNAAIAFNGHHYFQAGMSDDPGIAELIPAFSSLAGMSLAGAFDLLTFAVIALGLLIGYTGFRRLYPERSLRLVGAAVFLCLGLAQALVADVYIYQISPLIAGIPWILHFALSRKSVALNLSAALLAFCCSWCSLVRIGTTAICIAFLAVLFIARCRVHKVFLPLLLIVLACVPSILFERNLIARRDRFLNGIGQTATAVNNHPVWHSIYVGLGFVPNSEVTKFSDTVAMDKVRSVDPTVSYTSERYEIILRREVFEIAVHKPFLLIENLAAKGAIVAILAFIVLFPARRAIFVEKETRWLDAAFVAAITMSAANIVLVAPKPPYLLTFICLTFLYSSVKVCGLRSARIKHASNY